MNPNDYGPQCPSCRGSHCCVGASAIWCQQCGAEWGFSGQGLAADTVPMGRLEQRLRQIGTGDAMAVAVILGRHGDHERLRSALRMARRVLRALRDWRRRFERAKARMRAQEAR